MCVHVSVCLCLCVCLSVCLRACLYVDVCDIFIQTYTYVGCLYRNRGVSLICESLHLSFVRIPSRDMALSYYW